MEFTTISLLYTNDGVMPSPPDPKYLTLECLAETGFVVKVDETELWDKSVWVDRWGKQKLLRIYLTVDQLEQNKTFLENFFSAELLGAYVPALGFEDGGNPLVCTTDASDYWLKFVQLIDDPIVLKSCKVFR